MKLRRLAALTSLLAAGASVVPAPASQATTGATSCGVNGYVVKTPTKVEDASYGSGVFGTINVGPVPVPSRFACTGTVTGSGTATGTFQWCPEATANHAGLPPGTTFLCAPAGTPQTPDNTGTVTGDEIAWPAQSPINVHVVARATIASDPNAPLRNVVTGEVYTSCAITLKGHANATGAVLYQQVTCNQDTFTGATVAASVPIVGPEGDLFSASSGSNPQTCASFGSPDCFRAVIFAGNNSQSNPWPAPLPS